MKKRAIVIGATGLIGSSLVDILCEDDYFYSVKVVVRRSIDISHPKVSVHVIDFENQEEFKEVMKDSEIVFCAIGTTLKSVKGDMDAYIKVDYDIPVNAAKYCKEWGGSHFAVVSSLGADSSKSNFYLKMKGEMEDAVSSVGIQSLHIFRPSLLLGKRSESRFIEDMGQLLMPLISFLLPKNIRPINGRVVAQAMVNAVKSDKYGSFEYGCREMMS